MPYAPSQPSALCMWEATWPKIPVPLLFSFLPRLIHLFDLPPKHFSPSCRLSVMWLYSIIASVNGERTVIIIIMCDIISVTLLCVLSPIPPGLLYCRGGGALLSSEPLRGNCLMVAFIQLVDRHGGMSSIYPNPRQWTCPRVTGDVGGDVVVVERHDLAVIPSRQWHLGRRGSGSWLWP